ncbi:MAG: MinD/ParA family protein [Candidatus Omnitrophica bacterium]|nr:MinD/ParA family protein [Candidatus Omnitrophota bacterium]
MEKLIIAVVSGKGGVGKTTIATNIGVLGALSKKEIAIVDLDCYNPSVAFHLGLMHSSVGIKKILNGNNINIYEALIVHPPTGLRCLFPALDEDSDDVESCQKFHGIINKLNYQYIVIDCPPGLPKVVRETIKLATDIIVMLTPDAPSVTAALKITNIIKKYGKKNQKIRYVLNRVGGFPYELKKHEIERLLENEIFEVIPEDENIPRSIAQKIPIIMAYSKSRASNAIKKMSEKIYGQKMQFNELIDSMGRPSSIFSQIQQIIKNQQIIKKIFRKR